jgi:uncharacterized delta-60 repeat protein
VNMVNASLALDTGNEDVQFLTEAEVADLQAQALTANEISLAADEYLFPYGYVTRAAGSSTSRLLGAGGNTGTLNIAIRIPNNNPAPNNTVRRFSMTFVAFDAPVVSRVSESREEQGASSGAVTRATSFAALRVAALQNSPLHSTTTDGTKVNVCQVRTAGSATTPLVYLDTSTLSTTSGSRDTCFGAGGKRVFVDSGNAFSGQQLVRQADEKLVVAGIVKIGTQTDFSILRYNPDGSLDSNFGTNGQVTTDFSGSDDYARAITLDNNQRIVVVGGSSQFIIARYTTNGILDTTFDIDGKVTTSIGSSAAAQAVTVDSANKLVVAGTSSLGFTIAKYNTDGSLDTSFSGDGKLTFGNGSISDTAFAVLTDSSDNIFVGGYPLATTTPAFKIFKFNAFGVLDASFNGTGTVTGQTDSLLAMTFDQSGRIVIVGSHNNDFAIARYTATGVLDTSFDGDGKAFVDFGLNDYGASIAIDPNNKILVGGVINFSTPTMKSAMARLNADGSLDTSFASNGFLTDADFTTPSSSNDVNTGALIFTGISVSSSQKITALGATPSTPPSSGYPPYNAVLLQYNP